MVLRKIEFVFFLSTESTVLIRSGYSFVAVEVKVWKYNKTLNFRFTGKPVSFVFPRVVLFPRKITLTSTLIISDITKTE